METRHLWLALVLHLKLSTISGAYLSKTLEWSHRHDTTQCQVPVHTGTSCASSVQEVVIDPVTVFDAEVLANISHLIQKRAAVRWQGDYIKADEIRSQLSEVAVPPNCRIAIADRPRGVGGGSSWSLIYDVPVVELRPSALNIAHRALGLAVSYAESGRVAPPQTLTEAVEQVKEQLLKWKTVDSELRNSGEQGIAAVSFEKLVDCTSLSGDVLTCWSNVETQLSGRKAADAAFWFAIAGAVDTELFALLSRVCIKELLRFGDRPSCRPKDIMAIVERLAAAGIKDGDNSELKSVVKHCLTAKNIDVSHPIFSLHSDYTAVMIWNFSTRQRKQKSFLLEAATHWENHKDLGQIDDFTHDGWVARHETIALNDRFDDPTRDLVIDVGCGMGISLLGLASLNASDSNCGFNWSECNFIGVDLSPLTVNYANGVAKRWGLDKRLVFMVDSAEHFLRAAKTYRGCVKRVLIQFPTPYRLQSSQDSGNSQLPKTASDGFMVTQQVLKLASSLLREAQGALVLQSNCEDVAVWMRQAATQQAGFIFQETGDFVREIQGTPTQRTINWIASGGERAVGRGWCSTPVLPRTGRTETEIACIMNGTPVHRCILVPVLGVENVAE